MKKREYFFAMLIFSLLLSFTLSIFFKNTTISKILVQKQHINILKNLKQEYHELEVVYLQKNSLLNKELASELGFAENKNIKFASREGILVRADNFSSQ